MKHSGYATPEGTKRFAQRSEQTQGIPAEHFSTTAGGLTLSRLGMGSYLGDFSDQENTWMREAVIASINSGAINVLDTAINYRYQASEVSIGQALDQLFSQGTLKRDEVFVASKNGYLTPDYRVQGSANDYMKTTYVDTGIIGAGDVVGGIHCMTPTFLADQLQRSLNNLGLQTLDLMYLHNPAESQLATLGPENFIQNLAQAFAYLESARQDGKIRYYGIASWDCFRTEPGKDPSYMALSDVVSLAYAIAGQDHGCRFIQLPYNYAMLEALGYQNQPYQEQWRSLLDVAQALGIGVFTSAPLLQGQLLQHAPDISEIRPELTQPSQSCLQFARSTPGILAPLVGHKHPNHVGENLKVAKSRPLSEAEFEQFLLQNLEAPEPI